MSRTQWVGVLGIAVTLVAGWFFLGGNKLETTTSPMVASATPTTPVARTTPTEYRPEVAVSPEAAKAVAQTVTTKQALIKEMRSIVTQAVSQNENIGKQAEAIVNYFDRNTAAASTSNFDGMIALTGLDKNCPDVPCHLFTLTEHATGTPDLGSFQPNAIGPIGVLSVDPRFHPSDGFMPYVMFHEVRHAMMSDRGRATVDSSDEAQAHRFISALANAATNGEYASAIEELAHAVHDNAVPSVKTAHLTFAAPTTRIINCFGGRQKLSPFAAQGIYMLVILDLNTAMLIRQKQGAPTVKEQVAIYDWYITEAQDNKVQAFYGQKP